jgi:membrane-associated phospholipid phosphatase
MLNVFLKNLIQRPRPVFEHPFATLGSYSFPSGHTMAATLFYGLMAVFALIAMRGWRGKTMAVIVALLIVRLVAFSRVYLGVHY